MDGMRWIGWVLRVTGLGSKLLWLWLRFLAGVMVMVMLFCMAFVFVHTGHQTAHWAGGGALLWELR